MELIGRHLRPRLGEALDAFRAVVLHGARQCGKTTLARLVTEQRGGEYVSLDDDAEREAALADPLTFLAARRRPLAVDEIQLGGDRVVRAVKRLVDADPDPGRFLLTGSTNFLTVPTISESLAGRVRILRLCPLSERELSGGSPPDVGRWFEGFSGPPLLEHLGRDEYLRRLCRGGYPEAVRHDPARRGEWFESYLDTVIQRDLAALSGIRKATSLPRLLRWTASLGGGEVNAAAASRRLGIDRATVLSYLEWLHAVFLIVRLPAWPRNLTARAVRRPKIYLTDSGLAAHLIGADPDGLAAPVHPAAGPLIETFAVNEIARQISASPERIDMYHYRDHRGHEVDLILERPDGSVAAFEMKATRSPAAAQLGHVRWLRDRIDRAAPGLFKAGVLLHTGNQSVTVGDRLHLRPIQTLWRPGGQPASGAARSSIR